MSTGWNKLVNQNHGRSDPRCVTYWPQLKVSCSSGGSNVATIVLDHYHTAYLWKISTKTKLNRQRVVALAPPWNMRLKEEVIETGKSISVCILLADSLFLEDVKMWSRDLMLVILTFTTALQQHAHQNSWHIGRWHCRRSMCDKLYIWIPRRSIACLCLDNYLAVSSAINSNGLADQVIDITKFSCVAVRRETD